MTPRSTEQRWFPHDPVQHLKGSGEGLPDLQWVEKIAFLMIVFFCFFSVGCRQLPEKLTTLERSASDQGRKPPQIRDNPLLPLPQRSLRELHLSLRQKRLLVVPPPSFRDPKMFPCSACHIGEPNRNKRKLTKAHETHKMLHGGEHMWCFHCHAPKKVDRLRLADDTEISFERSHLLCFQCHGDKTRDWVAGIHGRTVGYWNGPKRYLLCTHCHDPHNPKPRKIKPMPMPTPPHLIMMPQRRFR